MLLTGHYLLFTGRTGQLWLRASWNHVWLHASRQELPGRPGVTPRSLATVLTTICIPLRRHHTRCNRLQEEARRAEVPHAGWGRLSAWS